MGAWLALNEAQFVAVGVTDGELACAVGRGNQRLEHFDFVAQFLPPCVDVIDLEVESGAGCRCRLVLPESELSCPQVEVNVCRRVWRPVAVRCDAQQALVPVDGGREIPDVHSHMR